MLHVPPASKPVTKPLIFIAGPIQGATDWQSQAIAYLSEHAPDCDIASPRRDIKQLSDFSHEQYLEQVDWEHAHLAIAAKTGCILFWLATQSHEVEGRTYAQTTRYELAEAVTMHHYGDASVVVGFEKGFSNSRYLRYTIAKKVPAIPLCETLEETCDKAISAARARAKA